MNYDFAQVVKVEGSEIMVMFTIEQEYREGVRIKKVLSGVDEEGNAYSALGINDAMDKTNATNVTKV